MRDPRFEKFVAVQAGPLLRLAYLLTHDHRDARTSSKRSCSPRYASGTRLKLPTGRMPTSAACS